MRGAPPSGRILTKALAPRFVHGIAKHKGYMCTGQTGYAKPAEGKSSVEFSQGQVIYSQEEVADSVFYIRKGRVKLSVISSGGNEAIISILEPGSFFGEGSLMSGRPVRVMTATSITRSQVVRLEKQEMIKRLHEDAKFADTFLSYLVARTNRVESDLVDHLFHSVEKRLARILLLLANVGHGRARGSIVPKISQETLAQMVGSSRARVSTFLNKFRRRGFIEYNGGLRVHNSLVNIILRS